MKNSKLILLLQSFSQKEIREFSKFIISPFFNQKEEVIQLYKVLKKEAPEFIDKKIERAVVMKKVFPNSIYDEKKYKYLSNLLLKLAEKYISLKELESRPLIQEYHLLNAYVKRNIDKNYNFIYRKSKEIQKNNNKRDADFYYKEYLLKNVAAEHFGKKGIRKNNEHVEQLSNAFDIYYFANKLKYLCLILNNSLIVPSNSETYLPQELIEFLNRQNLNSYPAINLYLNLYELLTKEENIFFIKIKDLLEEYKDLFSTEEMKVIYYAAINFCITQLTKNNDTDYYLQELYEMYQKGITSKLILDEGFLSPWTFKNVTKIGIRLKKYEETEAFIKKNKTRLKEAFQSDAFHYNMADLLYTKKNYDEALDYLNNVEYSDIYYVIGTKKLRLMIYFETDEFDSLDSNLSAFQNYLKRNKLIADNIKLPYLNFTKCLGKIIKNEHKKETLKKEINNTYPLTAKNWLLDIINP